MIADIKWDEFSPAYATSSLMLSQYDDEYRNIIEPKIYINLVYSDEDTVLVSEGVVSFEDLIAQAFLADEPADEQLALAKYFRSIADRLEEAAKNA